MLVKCHFVTWARHCWYIPLNLQFYMVFEKIPQLLIAVSLFRHSSLPFFFFLFSGMNLPVRKFVNVFVLNRCSFFYSDFKDGVFKIQKRL